MNLGEECDRRLAWEHEKGLQNNEHREAERYLTLALCNESIHSCRANEKTSRNWGTVMKLRDY